MITESKEKAEQKGLTAFRIRGWVEVEVNAVIYAKSIKQAKKGVIAEGKKYGKGNGSLFDYQEGDWCSDVHLETIEEDGKEETKEHFEG